MSKTEELTEPDAKKRKLEANEVSDDKVLISGSASPVAVSGIGDGDHVKADGVSLQQTSKTSSTADSHTATGKDFSFSKEPTLEQMRSLEEPETGPPPKVTKSTILATASTSPLEEKHCRSWTHEEYFPDLPALKVKIERDEGFIQVRNVPYLMTKSLKAALLHIIDDLVTELQNPADVRRKVLIYYGMPGIGKSVTARVLEFYLGLVYGVTWFGCFRHEQKSADTQATVNAMIQPPVSDPNVPDPLKAEVLIFDQVDCDIISAATLLSALRGREFPIIMFTSGHFVPCGDFIECPSKVKVETIHMTLTVEEGVALTHLSEETVTQLLEVSPTCGVLLHMSLLEGTTIEEKKERGLVDYSCPALSQIVPIVWYRCYSLIQLHSFEEAKQLKDFRMTIQDMEHFQSFMQNKKDYNNKSFNVIWKQIIPFDTKHETPEDQLTFTFFPFTDTGFELAPGEQLRFFKYCKELDHGDRAMLENVRAVFAGSAGSLKGLCFELMVRLHCRINECGLRPTEIYTDEYKGVQICEAFDCKRIVDQLFCKDDCKKGPSHDVNIWFSLDVPGKLKFPGYDFILVTGRSEHATNSFSIGLMYLIQLTVSLPSKTLEKKSIMVREYNKLMSELSRQKCINGMGDWMKVSCYICLPYVKSETSQSVPLQLKPEHKEELRHITENIRETLAANVIYTDLTIK